MSFYSELASDARALLVELGQAVVLTRIKAGFYNPATGTSNPTETNVNGYAAIFDVDQKMIDGTLIKAGDRAMILDAVSLAPRPGDVLTLVTSEELTVVMVKPLAPAGEVVIYQGILRARGEVEVPVFTPLDIPAENRWAWYRHDTGLVVPTGQLVQTWMDNWGLGHDVTQALEASRPTRLSDGTVSFNGTSSILTAVADAGFTQPATALFRVQFRTHSSLRRLCSGNSANGFSIAQVNPSPSLGTGSAGTYVGTSAGLPLLTWGNVAQVHDNGTGMLRINNDAPISGAIAIVNPGGFNMGGRSGPGNWADCIVSEAIVCKGALSASMIDNIFTYFSTVGP